MALPHWQNDVENTQWLELLHGLPTLKDLYLDEEFTPRVAPACESSWEKGNRSVTHARKYLGRGGVCKVMYGVS